MTIYDEIREERARQDAKWGGPDHDDGHGASDWVGFIVRHAAKSIRRDVARRAHLLEFADEYSPMERPPTVRKQLLRVAALAVAAIESLDRKNG